MGGGFVSFGEGGVRGQPEGGVRGELDVDESGDAWAAKERSRARFGGGDLWPKTEACRSASGRARSRSMASRTFGCSKMRCCQPWTLAGTSHRGVVPHRRFVPFLPGSSAAVSK